MKFVIIIKHKLNNEIYNNYLKGESIQFTLVIKDKSVRDGSLKDIFGGAVQYDSVTL